MFKFVNKKHCEIYENKAELLWGENKMSEQIASIYQQARQNNLEQKTLDDIMDNAIELMLKCEDDIDPKRGIKEAKRFNHGWSDDLMRKLSVQCKCKAVCSYLQNGNTGLATNMIYSIGKLYKKTIHVHAPPEIKASKKAWGVWQKNFEGEVKKETKTMHLEHRQKVAEAVSEHKAKVEKSRLSVLDQKKYWQHLSDKVFAPPARWMRVNGKWLRKPNEIIDAEDDFLEEHMAGTKDTFHSDVAREGDEECKIRKGARGVGTVDNPFCAINDEGIRLRKQVADGLKLEWEGCVPMEVIPFFRLGTRKINTILYGNMFSEPINFNEFRTYISVKRKNKAPGMSGVRIDHICGLHEQGQKDINLLLSITYISEMTFSAWHKEIINWIPKEPGNPAMDRRRPICLLEVMRKIALGIKSR